MTGSAQGAPRSVEELEDRLSEPNEATVAALRDAPGDVIVLGAGGKMGPTLARMAARAARAADGGHPRKIIAVSRFTSSAAADSLERSGVAIIRCDLLDPGAVERLPDAPNVVFMAGQKFGTTESPGHTWMMNVAVPALCAHRYSSSRIVAFSTGNVYPLVPVADGGAAESTEARPIGDYAASCLVREKVFEFSSAAKRTPVALMRLNYAIDLRYGVLTDIAQRIANREPIDLTMGYVNVIWQGDANRAALQLLPLASSPPLTLNVSGAETLRVQTLATELGARLGISPEFNGSESPDALLTDTKRFRSMFGEPEVSASTLLDWVADWVRSARPLLGKPTHFETRGGAF